MIMAAFHRILVCYDGTPEGRAALCNGARLAQHLNASMHLLAVLDHAYWARGFEVLSPVTFDVDDDATQQVLSEGLQRLSELGIAAIGHVVTGNSVNEISKLAEDLAADLIVIGHHHGNPFMRWWTGENDALLLNRVHCSVLFETSAENA
jgi:nucleotide-binding universal stress UspA family protein